MRQITARCIFCVTLAFAGCAQAFDLVKDRVPTATVVLADQATDMERQAAAALVAHLQRTSGATLPLTNETAGIKGAVVSVGHTALAKAAGISAADLVNDAYRIRVKDGTLFLLGRDVAPKPGLRGSEGAQGTRRAVLGFLEHIGFRWVQPSGDGLFVPDLPDVSVADNLDITFSPRFYFTTGRFGRMGDWSLVHGFRLPLNLYTEGGHTWCTFVPTNHWAAHPEYFQLRKGARVKPEGDGYFLCPSNPDVQKLLAEGLRRKFDEGYDWVQLGHSDGYRPCECEVCKALDRPGEWCEQVHTAHYNAIRMVQQTHPDKKVHLLIYPPTHIPSRRVERWPPNVLPEVCLTGSMALQFMGEGEVLTAESRARGHRAALDYWSSKMPAGTTVYVYYMGTYQKVGLAPKFTPRQAAEQIRLLHEKNVKGIYFCGGGENWGAEGPTYYVIGRLMNDPAQAWEPLVDEYCRCTYGRAAQTMRAYYDLLYAQIEAAPFAVSSDLEYFQLEYTPPVLEQLSGLLRKAREEAADNPRALKWLDLADISYRHYAGLARSYRLYEAFLDAPTPENFAAVKASVLDYTALCDRVLELGKKDPVYVRDYFPGWNRWSVVRENGGMGGANLRAPFTWDFDELAKSGHFPSAIVNGSFESTNLELTAPTEWHFFPVQATGISIDRQAAYEGRNALHMQFDPAQPKAQGFVVTQMVKRRYEAGKRFRFSCWVKSRDLLGKAMLGVFRYPVVAEDREVIYSTVLRGTHDWTQLSVTFDVRPGMTDCQVRCQAGGTDGEVWFDGAELEEVLEKQ